MANIYWVLYVKHYINLFMCIVTFIHYNNLNKVVAIINLIYHEESEAWWN